MAGVGTPKWTLRLERELQAKALAKAQTEGRTLADVVREFIENYAKD